MSLLPAILEGALALPLLVLGFPQKSRHRRLAVEEHLVAIPQSTGSPHIQFSPPLLCLCSPFSPPRFCPCSALPPSSQGFSSKPMDGLQEIWETSGLGKQNVVCFSLEMGSGLLSNYQRPVTQKGQEHSA